MHWDDAKWHKLAQSDLTRGRTKQKLQDNMQH